MAALHCDVLRGIIISIAVSSTDDPLRKRSRKPKSPRTSLIVAGGSRFLTTAVGQSASSILFPQSIDGFGQLFRVAKPPVEPHTSAFSSIPYREHKRPRSCPALEDLYTANSSIRIRGSFTLDNHKTIRH